MNRSANTLNISGFSTALFSTWYYVDELGLLLDCGDGVTSSLLQKARKVKNVFISHADRDHVAGLLQFLQLNSRPGLKIHYPKSSGSFPALAEFSARFDPQVSGVQWIALEDGDEIPIRNDLVVRTQSNQHVIGEPGSVKSLGFHVEQTKQKLRPECQSMRQSEIIEARNAGKTDELFVQVRKTILAYSGDTPIETDGRWNDVDTLIHEATFLNAEEVEDDNPRRNKHSSLDQVLSMAASSNLQRLVLGQFSCRYADDEIDDAIRSGCMANHITFPVYRLLPGKCHFDVLNTPFISN